jgi:hypothetical protein
VKHTPQGAIAQKIEDRRRMLIELHEFFQVQTMEGSLVLDFWHHPTPVFNEK